MIKTWQELLSSSPLQPHPREAGFRAAKASKSLLQRMGLLHTLDDHRGCVNTVVWNDTGHYVLSGSDDHRIIITDPFTRKVLVDKVTSHRTNIFCAKFLPASCDKKVVSCSGTGTILFTDLERFAETLDCSFTCHNGTAYELLTMPGDPNSFLSCGEDGSVRWIDLRSKEQCHKNECKDDVIISLRHAVTSMSLNPLLPFYLAVGSADSTVRLFDRRMLSAKGKNCLGAMVTRFQLPEMEGKRHRITAIDYRPDAQEILVSFSSDYIYTFNPNLTDVQRGKKLFVGPPPPPEMCVIHVRERSPPPIKRLRFRGDWSDTGPNARPENEDAAIIINPSPMHGGGAHASRADGVSGPVNVLQRMTDALSRLLNDHSTRSRPQQSSESRPHQVSPAVDAFSTVGAGILPGPSQVVTDPGVPGTNPETGQRQRRRGVSGPPTGTIEFPAGVSGMAAESDVDFVELEVACDLSAEDEAAIRDNQFYRLINQPAYNCKLTGHRNVRTVIKEATWWGTDYILSGSDCGHIFAWDRRTQKVVLLLEADRHVVNCVQPHPFDPVMVSSGIDHNIKVWTPHKIEADFDERTADNLAKRNEVMLEVTRDTITVPATMMIRVLAALYQGRRGPLRGESRRESLRHQDQQEVEFFDDPDDDEAQEDF